MKSILTAFLAAVIFGVGLGISGMTLPSKVIGFLDVTGNWDISLMFVMVGAILTHGIAYQFIIKREKPVIEDKFQVPATRAIDARLLSGAAIFGVGWGLGGFCPAPAIVSLTTGMPEVMVFVGCMILGIYLFRTYQKISMRQ